MLLLRKKEFHRIFLNALNCKSTDTLWLSFFYGDKLDTDKYENTDFEFNLIKKLSNPASVFSKEERSALLFYSTIKRLTLIKKSKNISTASYYIIQNAVNLKKIKEYFKASYLHPIYKAKTSGILKKEFVLCETVLHLAKDNLTDLSDSYLSDRISGFDEISARSISFINRYLENFNIDKIKKDSFIYESVKGSPCFKVIKQCNVNEMSSTFSYLNKDVIILCLEHLKQDGLIRVLNGNVILSESFIYDYNSIAALESLAFKKQLNDLHLMLSNGDNMILRCDDKDVYKLFKRACYEKM